VVAAVITERVEPAEDESVIVFCPVDCTPVDAAASQTEFTCPVCDQPWTMLIDLERIAAHSPA
jgi:transcription initiation factor IIE alpha subunit